MNSDNRSKRQNSAGLRRSRREAGPTLGLDVIVQIEHALLDSGWTREILASKSGVDERTIQSWLAESARERAVTNKPMKPRLLLPVLQALGIANRVTRRAQFPVRTPAQIDVFLAAAMESLGDSYSASRDDLLTVISVIREAHGLSVFYAGESRASSGAFEDEAWALADNCDVLDHTKRLVMIYPAPAPDREKPVASSALVEVGYAIALRLPILIFYRHSLNTLPYLLRKLPQVFSGCTLVQYRDRDDLLQAIKIRHRDFFTSSQRRVGTETV